jgi:hypothetical protein
MAHGGYITVTVFSSIILCPRFVPCISWIIYIIHELVIVAQADLTPLSMTVGIG